MEGSLAKYGDRGLFVLTLRSNMRMISSKLSCIPLIEERGEFDKALHKAVLEFQQFHGLDANGEVDYNTWEKITTYAKAVEKSYFFDYPGYELELGYSGWDVVRLKNMLIMMKKTVPSVRLDDLNDVFDDQTELSLIRVQKALGLIPNGKAGKDTWESVANHLQG